MASRLEARRPLTSRSSVTEAVHRLRSALADRYRIEHELGQGGMLGDGTVTDRPTPGAVAAAM
jgi:hypothetical protein